VGCIAYTLPSRPWKSELWTSETSAGPTRNGVLSVNHAQFVFGSPQVVRPLVAQRQHLQSNNNADIRTEVVRSAFCEAM
jgi:hypothetical protein